MGNVAWPDRGSSAVLLAAAAILASMKRHNKDSLKAAESDFQDVTRML